MAIRIYIDQGHNPTGYHNSGAQGYGLYEENITYMVGVYLADLLNADPNFEVMLSRNTPYEVLGYNNTSSLRERVTEANSWPADYFISIHVNASENPNQNGTEAYVYSLYTESYYFAETIVSEIVRRLGTNNNGVLAAPSFYVLRNTNMPSALLELAYITNYDDEQKLANNQYEFAYAIYNGLLIYFGLL